MHMINNLNGLVPASLMPAFLGNRVSDYNQNTSATSIIKYHKFFNIEIFPFHGEKAVCTRVTETVRKPCVRG